MLFRSSPILSRSSASYTPSSILVRVCCVRVPRALCSRLQLSWCLDWLRAVLLHFRRTRGKAYALGPLPRHLPDTQFLQYQLTCATSSPAPWCPRQLPSPVPASGRSRDLLQPGLGPPPDQPAQFQHPVIMPATHSLFQTHGVITISLRGGVKVYVIQSPVWFSHVMLFSY